MKLKNITVIFISLFFFSNTSALELTAKGFLTFAYNKSNTKEPYQGNISEDGEYSQGTRAGLQFSSLISSKTEAFIQALADGSNGRDFNFSLDIGHIGYNFNNDHKVIVGKIRLPIFMISDHRQVGFLYPWINPPEEVYEIVPFDEIGADERFFGASFEGVIFRNELHDLSYRFYHGGTEGTSGGIESRVKNLHGLSLDYKLSNLEFKLSYLNTLSQAEETDNTGKTFDVSKGRTEYMSIGFRHDGERFLVMSEASRIIGEIDNFEDVRSYYLMGGIYLNDQKLLLHSTYSEVFENSKSDLDIFQSSISLGANYFIDFSTVFKVEYKRVFLQKPPAFDGGSPEPKDAGFFDKHPNKDVGIISLSVDTMF